MAPFTPILKGHRVKENRELLFAAVLARSNRILFVHALRHQSTSHFHAPQTTKTSPPRHCALQAKAPTNYFGFGA